MTSIAALRAEAPPAPAQARPDQHPASFCCWTDTAVARLRLLWGTGRPVAQIAREIGGFSRSAVIGKVRRLGLGPGRAAVPRSPEISAVPGCGSPASEPSRAEKARLQRERALARRQALREQAPPEPVPPEVRPRCSLLELGRDTCRWPIGDPGTEGFHFCGAPPDDGHPYCAHHRHIAHARPINGAVRR